MFEYFVEEPRMVLLKKQISTSGSLQDRRIQRLFDIFGDVQISKDFIAGYLEYFDYSCAKRGNLPLTDESLIGIYEISKAYLLIFKLL